MGNGFLERIAEGTRQQPSQKTALHLPVFDDLRFGVQVLRIISEQFGFSPTLELTLKPSIAIPVHLPTQRHRLRRNGLADRCNSGPHFAIPKDLEIL